MLDKFLKKIGVRSYEDLNAEEKETFKAWELALSGRRITDPEYRAFLESELAQAIIRLTEENLSKEADTFRKVEVRLIKKIVAFLDMPVLEKAMAEKQLQAQL